MKIRKDKFQSTEPLRKGGEYWDSDNAVKAFGLQGIQFGNWMNEQERQEYMYAGLTALDDLAKLLKVSRKEISLGGRLSLALGARGNGGRASAHYEGLPSSIINLPKNSRTRDYKGIGAVAHEWAHAVDNIAWQHDGGTNSDPFASSGRSSAVPKGANWTPNTTRHTVDTDGLKGEGLRPLMEQLLALLYWKDGKKTKFHEGIAKTKSEYLNRRIEVWARTFEAWCRHIGGSDLNRTLCNTAAIYNSKWTFEKGEFRIYPDGQLLNLITPLMWKIVHRIFHVLPKIKAGATQPDYGEWTKQEQEPFSVRKLLIGTYLASAAALRRDPNAFPEEQRRKGLEEFIRKSQAIADELMKLQISELRIVWQIVGGLSKAKVSKLDMVESILRITAADLIGWRGVVDMNISRTKFFIQILEGKQPEPAKQKGEERKEPEEKPKQEEQQRKGRPIYGNETEIETREGAKPARYVLMELSKVIASNDHNKFKPTEGYPLKCQQRDYSNDKAEQHKVVQNADNFQPKFLLSDDPTAGNGPPVVWLNDNKTAYVLGGNSRTMSIKRIADKGEYDDYTTALVKKAEQFGFEKSSLNNFTFPILVREIEVEMARCASISRLLNENLTQDIDARQKTIAIARELTYEDIQAIARSLELSDAKTISEALGTRSFAGTIREILLSRGVISRHNIGEWFTSEGVFNDEGKNKVQGILLGTILKDRQLIESAKNYTDKLIKVLPLLVRSARLSKQWDLTADITEVIKLEASRRASGLKKSDFLSSVSMYDDPPTDRQITIWELLDGPLTQWKAALDLWVTKAESEYQAGRYHNPLGFDTVKHTPDTVYKMVKSKFGLADSDAGEGFSSWDSHSYAQAPETQPENDSVRRRYKLGELRMLNIQSIPLNQRWQSFLGALPVPFRLRMWGTEGSGKSTLAMELVDTIGNHNPRAKILYAAFEEGASAGGFSARAETTSATASNVDIVEFRNLGELSEEIALHKPDLIVIDSVNAASEQPQEIIDLLQQHKQISFILVQHAISDGTRAKGADIGYYVDTSIQIKDGIATTSPRKNRFGRPATMNVFQRRQ